MQIRHKLIDFSRLYNQTSLCVVIPSIWPLASLHVCLHADESSDWFFSTADSNVLHTIFLLTVEYRRTVLEKLTPLFRLYCCHIPPVLNFRWSVLTWKNAQEYWNQTCKQKIIHRNSSAQVRVWLGYRPILSFSWKIMFWFFYLTGSVYTLYSLICNRHLWNLFCLFHAALSVLGAVSLVFPVVE